MSILSSTQTATAKFDAAGKLIGIENIDTEAGVLAGTMKALANPFNGGENVVVGAANLVALAVSSIGVAFAREKIQDATGFDPFFGLVR